MFKLVHVLARTCSAPVRVASIFVRFLVVNEAQLRFDQLAGTDNPGWDLKWCLNKMVKRNFQFIQMIFRFKWIFSHLKLKIQMILKGCASPIIWNWKFSLPAWIKWWNGIFSLSIIFSFFAVHIASVAQAVHSECIVELMKRCRQCVAPCRTAAPNQPCGKLRTKQFERTCHCVSTLPHAQSALPLVSSMTPFLIEHALS